MLVTLGIGWLIWTLFFTASRGQTPAKQLLGMRIVRLDTGRAAGWWRVFLREVIAKPIVSLLGSATLGITNFWLLWDRNNQQLYDKLANTIVVNDPQFVVPLHRIDAPVARRTLSSPVAVTGPDYLERRIRDAEAVTPRPAVGQASTGRASSGVTPASSACPHCGSEELDDLKQVGECTSCGKRFRRPETDLKWKPCSACAGARQTIAETGVCAGCGAELRRSLAV